MELRELTALRGISGDEGEVRGAIVGQLRKLGVEYKVDRIGNVIAFKEGTGAWRKRALLAAHMDEIGLIALCVNDNGLISFQPVGGVDARVLVSKRVLVGKAAVPGVIGAKAIHLQTPEERKQVLRHDQLYIDIGAKDRASAEKLVSPGDFASLDSAYVEFGDGFVKAKALDDRVSCYNLLRLLEGAYPCDLYCAFTVQEEVGLRGAKVVGRNVEADCALALEGTAANDLGDVPEHLRVCRAGKGVAISFMDNASLAHTGLNRALRDLAERHGIAWQVKSGISGGNDAGAIQTARGATATCVLSVPCRYIHSPSSVAKLSDIEAQYALVEAFLQSGAAF